MVRIMISTKVFLPLLILFLLHPQCQHKTKIHPQQRKKIEVIGTKIYEAKRNDQEIFRKWQQLGINTAFIGADLATSSDFIRRAKNHQITTFIIVPIFCSLDKTPEDPGLYAINGRGERAQVEWVHFICPTREQYRKERIQFIIDLITRYDPDGISIDFIRYFVYWEKVYPETKLDPLDNTCFCDNCLRKMEEVLDFKIPVNLVSRSQKATWVLTNMKEKWVSWKVEIIGSMVKEIASAAKRVKPGIILNAHIVPWRQQDFSNGIRMVAGQDLKTIAQYVDYISPMCYHFMVKRNSGWIRSVVRDMAGQVKIKILPSIQVKESYLEKKLYSQEFGKALENSLFSPSSGIVFWNWESLESDSQKIKMVKSFRLNK